ncbi:hypothetical protein ACSBR2_009987 [Camellia fascicularis]
MEKLIVGVISLYKYKCVRLYVGTAPCLFTNKQKVGSNHQQTQTHFVLVHGACHGAWCWYKLKPLLESHGHKVTALDLSTSDINMKKIQQLRTLYDHTEPLMEVTLPSGEKVVLVGHSLGGLNLALAMDKFPQKISAAVFLTAFMPDTVHKPSFVIEQIQITQKLIAESDIKIVRVIRPGQCH